MELPDLDTLSLPEQVAQMVVVRASGYQFDHQIQYPDWEPPAAFPMFENCLRTPVLGTATRGKSPDSINYI